ncbi:MAG: hypothetical protein ACFCVF_06800 [Kineosporiaceae bacterium]
MGYDRWVGAPPMPGRPRIDVVETPDEVMSKIEGRHGVSYDDVDEVLSGAFSYSWSFEDARGWRLYVQGRARSGNLLKVVLRLVDSRDGVWRLRPAFWTNRPL